MARRLAAGLMPLELSVTIKRILCQPQRNLIDAGQKQEVYLPSRTCISCPPRLKRETKYACRKYRYAFRLECANMFVECD